MDHRRGATQWLSIVWLGLAAACRTDPAAAPACPPGERPCGGACAALASDPANCGGCGIACGSGEVCQAGACIAVCGTPLVPCDDGDGPRCVDPTRDVSHCGGCDVACRAGELCVSGSCENPCGDAGWRLCDGRCRRLAVDGRYCGGCGIACGAGQVCSEAACVDGATAPRPNLVVSISADDGIGSQADYMAPMLEARGMRGTFFAIVGRIDLPEGDNLTSEALWRLSRAGHEVGLHGLTHTRDVTSATPAIRIRREICDGRSDLLSRGFEVRTLAYPFGPSDGVSRGLAQECGFSAGRNAGGATCASCPVAESWPPADRFAIRTPASVKMPDDVARLQAYVTDAEATGGWLVVNFHRVVPLATCPAECFPSEWFEQWLDWLAAREDRGTVVRTIEQMIGGELGPAVASGTPPLILGDMESHAAGPDALPDCWSLGGERADTSWASVPGRSGVAAQIQADPMFAGSIHTFIQDRGSSLSPDYRSCGTQVLPGATYTFGCWVRSDVPVRLVLYANDGAVHRVVTWTHGDWQAVSPTAWTRVALTAAVPLTFNTVYFGPSMSEPCTGDCLGAPGTATLQVDDCDAEVGGG